VLLVLDFGAAHCTAPLQLAPGGHLGTQGTPGSQLGKVSRLYPPNEGSLAGCGHQGVILHVWACSWRVWARSSWIS